MADRVPLRIVSVSGEPFIGEFQSGDTIGLVHGGTGVSSLAELISSVGLNDLTLSGSLNDVTIGGLPEFTPVSGDVLTWNGYTWEPEHIPHLEFRDYSGAPYNISSISFLTNLGSITLQEGEIAWDGTASTIQVQTDASTTQLAVLQVSSASNDGDILLWDGTKGYYYPTSAFVDVSSQVDANTSALENTLDASDLSVELSAISTELSAISIDISAVGIEVSSVSVQLSSLVSSIHLSGLGDVSFTDLSADQHLNWDGTNWVNADNDRTEMRVRNGTASPMSKGDAIAIESAHNQNLVNVVLADASQTSAMPALGILKDDLAVGAEGIAITFGKAQGLNTSGLTEGATAYVSPTTPGTITETKPTDVSHLIQNIGIIMRAHPSNGAIKVTGIGRANDIDNQTRADIAANTSAIDNALDLSDIVTYIEHGDLNGLGDNDHPQYILSAVPTMTEGGVSVTGVGACPHPQPFWYGQTTADATASRSYDWGSAATETEVVCDDHFNWDSANSRLYVSSTGVYEVDVMFMVDGGSDFTAEVIVKVDGTGKNTTTHDYVSANSPSEYSGRWVGKISAGSYITATFRDAAVVVSTSHEAGSTMIVKRLA